MRADHTRPQLGQSYHASTHVLSAVGTTHWPQSGQFIEAVAESILDMPWTGATTVPRVVFRNSTDPADRDRLLHARSLCSFSTRRGSIPAPREIVLAHRHLVPARMAERESAVAGHALAP